MRRHGGALGLVRPARFHQPHHPLLHLLLQPAQLLRKQPSPGSSPGRRSKGDYVTGSDATVGRAEAWAEADDGGPDRNVARKVFSAKAEDPMCATEHPALGLGNPSSPQFGYLGCKDFPTWYGSPPPVDFLGRPSWLKTSTYFCGERKSQPGEFWRFPVQAYPGSGGRFEWVEVLIPQGQGTYLFAARRELGIPGAAPMTYVSDEGPAEYH